MSYNVDEWIEKEQIRDITTLLENVLDRIGIEKHEGNRETPYRMAKMYVNEFFKHANNNGIHLLKENFKMFDAEGLTKEPVELKGIKFTSMCEHHWLPFSGEFRISYIPNKKVAGLSKLPRAVEFFSKKPQLQERITLEVGDFLKEMLDPLALFIEVKAQHGCMMCRGVESDSETYTRYKYVKESYNIGDEYERFRRG